jgi:hypothetical protein
MFVRFASLLLARPFAVRSPAAGEQKSNERKSGQRKHENPWHDLLLLDDDRNPFCQN